MNTSSPIIYDVLESSFWFSSSEDVRNLVFIIVAIVGIALAVWRNISLHRSSRAQSKSSESQAQSSDVSNKVYVDNIYNQYIDDLCDYEKNPTFKTLSIIQSFKPFTVNKDNSKHNNSINILYNFLLNLEKGKQLTWKQEVLYKEAMTLLINRPDWEMNAIDYSKLPNLRKVDLRYSSFVLGEIKWMDLSNIDISASNFNTADLTNTNLENSNLEESFMPRVKLSWSILNKTNFASANLYYATLDGVDLKTVNFTNTDLSRINFSKTKNITFEQLSKARSLYKVHWLNKKLKLELENKCPELFRKQVSWEENLNLYWINTDSILSYISTKMMGK